MKKEKKEKKEDIVWSPIEDLPEDWQSLGNPQIEALVQAWQERADRMRQSGTYDDLLGKMRRQWAVETGIIERLYDIDDGVTKTILEQGLEATFLSHDEADGLPIEAKGRIRDQHSVLEGLYDFVSGNRQLGTSYIKELHQELTAHQTTYKGVDTAGRPVEAVLPRAAWRKNPSRVVMDEGVFTDFCPPEQVASEVDNMLKMYETHEERGVPAGIRAAWLLHRFTLIHPFVDGNGRVARCLATLVLIKTGWLPLIVRRRDRPEYLTALKSADKGALKPLVELVHRLQGIELRGALSLSEGVIEEAKAVHDILGAVKDKLRKAREELETKKQQVLEMGDALVAVVEQHLNNVAQDITDAIKDEEPKFRAYSHHAGRNNERANYHYYQIVQCAKKLGYYANFRVFQGWAVLVIIANTRTEIMFAFHGMGTGSSGVLVCSAMAYTKEPTKEGNGETTDESAEERESVVIGEVTPLCNEPFSFTYAEDLSEVNRRFEEWLNDRVIGGLDYWREVVGA